MVRSFEATPLEPALVDELLDLARRGPSAGNSQAVSFVVLDGEATQRYWDVTLPPDEHAHFAWPGLLRAPVVVVVVTDPMAYVRRYAEPDKTSRGLGVEPGDWPVPYWFVDAGAVVQNLLLLATAEGLGALFFGAFTHEASLVDALDIEPGRRIVGVVALGRPDSEQRPSRSSRRPRPPLADIIRRP